MGSCHPPLGRYPSQLALDDQAINAGEAALLQDLEIGHSVLPLDVADLEQTSLVKLLQLLDVPAVGGPRLAAIQKREQDHSSVYDNLSGEADAVVLPKSLCQSALGRTCLSKALHHIIVQGSTACNSATEIAEPVRNLDRWEELVVHWQSVMARAETWLQSFQG